MGGRVDARLVDCLVGCLVVWLDGWMDDLRGLSVGRFEGCVIP